MNYEELVEQCKQFRAKAERAEAEFLAFLMLAEGAHDDVWKGAGCATFEQFLRSNHLCRPERYSAFVRGVDRVGKADALVNGAAWTIEASKFGDEHLAAIEQFSARATAFVETEKVAPSEETVREWRAQIEQSTKEHSTVRRASELHRLRAENQKLRAELKSAQSLIVTLQGKLEARGKKGAGGLQPQA